MGDALLVSKTPPPPHLSALFLPSPSFFPNAEPTSQSCWLYVQQVPSIDSRPPLLPHYNLFFSWQTKEVKKKKNHTKPVFCFNCSRGFPKHWNKMKLLSLPYVIWPPLFSFSSLGSCHAGLTHLPQGLCTCCSFYLDLTSLQPDLWRANPLSFISIHMSSP